MLPEPDPVLIEAGTAPRCSAVDRAVSVRTVKQASFGIAGAVFPLLVFNVAVDKGEAVAAAIVFGRDIRVAWSCQVTLQITIVEAVHGLIRKDPAVGHAHAIKVADFCKQFPIKNIIRHVPVNAWGHPGEISCQCGIHRDAAESLAIVGWEVIAWAPVNVNVSDIGTEAVGFVIIDDDIIRGGRPALGSWAPTDRLPQ